MPNKDLFGKEEKEDMWQTMLARPRDFFVYCVDDATFLRDVLEAFINLNRRIQTELGLRERDLWGIHIPPTTGRLVAVNLEKWLLRQTGDLEECVKVCLLKLGIGSNTWKPGYNPSEARWRRRLVLGRYRMLEDLQQGFAGGDQLLKDFLKDRYDFTGLDSCGAKAWACLYPHTNSACFNSLVYGGRCLNENPRQLAVDYALDIDISGAYGSRQRHLVFPLGLPKPWGWTNSEDRPSLAEFLRENHWGTDRNELLDGLCQLFISGTLTFPQDLLFSKRVKPEDVRRVALKWDADKDAKLHVDTPLVRYEVRHAVVTPKLLRALRAIGTDQEWKEVLNLKVEAAAAYRRSDRRDSLEEWCREVLADTGGYRCGRNAGIDDDRTRTWYPIPLEGFAGHLADLRDQQEALTEDPNRTEEERQAAHALRTMLKGHVNTLAGDLMSPLFPIGNTILGNSITSDVRLGVWMLAKALGLRQCITDGALYSPALVPFFKGKCPGLATLANLWNGGWKTNAGGKVRGWQPLGGLDWAGRWDELSQDSKLHDELALKHIREFWAEYGLGFDFEIKHKAEHASRRASYFNKGDYAFLVPDKKTGRQKFVHAVRGCPKQPRPGEKEHPKITLLRNALEGSEDFPADMEYTKRGSLLKIAGYKLLQASTSATPEEKALRPGDNLPDKARTARFNNMHMPVDTFADLERRLERQRKKFVKGKWWPLFERHHRKGSAGVLTRMETDKL
jgi:hypothetical protein